MKWFKLIYADETPLTAFIILIECKLAFPRNCETLVGHALLSLFWYTPSLVPSSESELSSDELDSSELLTINFPIWYPTALDSFSVLLPLRSVCFSAEIVTFSYQKVNDVTAFSSKPIWWSVIFIIQIWNKTIKCTLVHHIMVLDSPIEIFSFSSELNFMAFSLLGSCWSTKQMVKFI